MRLSGLRLKIVRRWSSILLVLISCTLLVSCGDSAPSNATPTSPARPNGTDASLYAPAVTPDPTDPAIASRIQQLETALKAPIPVITLTTGLTDGQTAAQDIAIHDSNFQQYMYSPNTKVSSTYRNIWYLSAAR